MNDDTDTAFVQVKDIFKSFTIGSHRLSILNGVSFSIEKGDFLALYGASGSGKTTLLDILGTLSKPDSGHLRINGVDPETLSSRALVSFRRKNIGFVFQAYHILPELNVLENVMLPGRLSGLSRKESKERAEDLLEKVSLSHRLVHRPNELSGGEQQRAAIARALMNHPPLLLADEPTGNLDSQTGKGILELFMRFKEESDTTIIMVTHDRSIADSAKKVIELKDGTAWNKDQAEQEIAK